MRSYFLCSLLSLTCFQFGCAFPHRQLAATSVLTGSQLHPLGRYVLNGRQELELVGSAAHFTFTFIGSSCLIYASASAAGAHNYLQYEVDGVYQKRVRVDGVGSAPVAIRTAGSERHQVTVYKATEAHSGALIIHKVEGASLRVLPPGDLPLIEFIGNSITAGAAADTSGVPCGSGQYHDQHNAYQAYGPRVARALSANFIMSSVSGTGIYRTWNREGPSMPRVYGRTDFREDGAPWIFPWQPQVVSIALGTNDLSNGDGKSTRAAFDSSTFVNDYIAFVQTVRKRYPAAKVALLSSPTVGGDRGLLLRNCLTAVVAAIDPLYPGRPMALYFFKPMQPRGCTGHPSVEDHALLAEEVVAFYRELLR